MHIYLLKYNKSEKLYAFSTKKAAITSVQKLSLKYDTHPDNWEIVRVDQNILMMMTVRKVRKIFPQSIN